MLTEKINLFFKNIGQSDDFEPLAIRRMRRYYLFFSYTIFVVYFVYIVYSVVNASTVVTQDEDFSSLHDSRIPNVYFLYETDSNNNSYDPNLNVHCIYTTTNDNSVHNCDSFLNNYIDKADFGADYSQFRFGDGTENGVTYISLLTFLIDFDPQNTSSISYRGDYIAVNFDDPDINEQIQDNNNRSDAIQYTYNQKNTITVDQNEYLYVVFSRTLLNTLDLAYDWLNRIGIYKSNGTTSTINIIPEFHQRPTDGSSSTSVVVLYPYSFVIMREKEAYTPTFISSIGSLSSLIGAFGVVGFFLFGSKRLKAFGYFHWRYHAQYKKLLNNGGDNHLNMTFEEAIESLGEEDKNILGKRESNSDPLALTTPFELSGPELQIRILTNWF